jgi:rhodanese-related sulfurtransferase
MATKAQKRNQARKKKQTIQIGGFAIIILLVTIINLSNQTSPLEISIMEANEKMEAGVFVLDVREPSEWVEHHIEGSTLIPLGELASRLDEIPEGQEVVVVCRSGNRSQTGRDILLDGGFQQVTSMAGGLNGWIAADFEYVTGP